MKITVYLSDTCHYCQSLKKWLEENGVEYMEKNINEPQNVKELVDNGIEAVPYTIIEDEKTLKRETFMGFDELAFVQKLL